MPEIYSAGAAPQRCASARRCGQGHAACMMQERHIHLRRGSSCGAADPGTARRMERFSAGADAMHCIGFFFMDFYGMMAQ